MPTKLCKSNPLSFILRNHLSRWKVLKENKLWEHRDQMINLASTELWMFYLPSEFRPVKNADVIQTDFLSTNPACCLAESKNAIFWDTRELCSGCIWALISAWPSLNRKISLALFSLLLQRQIVVWGN